MHKKKTLPLKFILIFVAGILLAIVITAVMPIPSNWKGLVGFAIAIALCAGGLAINGIIMRKKNGRTIGRRKRRRR